MRKNVSSKNLEPGDLKFRAPSAEKTDQINLRVPPGFKATLKACAKEDGRTVSNFIIRLIERAIYSPAPWPKGKRGGK